MRILLSAAICLLLLNCTAWAESPVDFADARLKAAVEEALWVSDPTPTDMVGLTSLTCVGEYVTTNAIVSLTGLEHATNLQTLTMRNHLIDDLSPLAGLTNLHTLTLDNNRVSDLSPLASLAGLRELDLTRNLVSDCSPVAGLTELSVLSLHRNPVSDISPLTTLTNLTWLDLRVTPLNEEAYETHIDQIFANNPGIWFVYDPHLDWSVTIRTTVGGSVTSPGVGVFKYPSDERILLKAVPDAGYRFLNWSGTYFSSQNPAHLQVIQDFDLLATFVRDLKVIHVDASAEPTDATPRKDGTPEYPFDRIQEAIDVAPDGARIVVGPGTYRENINLRGKRIHLSGWDPNGQGPVDYPVIAAPDARPAVACVRREPAGCMLSGFVIRQGRGEPASAIHCLESRPTVAHCLIVGNRATSADGAAIYCVDSTATFVNCTIADNLAGELGAAIVADQGHVTVINSILDDIASHQVRPLGDGRISIFYSAIPAGVPVLAEALEAGAGNLAVPPLFVRRGQWVDREDGTAPVWVPGDYHLKSQAGRWDPVARAWQSDTVSTLCIDAGRPADSAEGEPAPSGGRINMGAYGGTSEASKSYLSEK